MSLNFNIEKFIGEHITHRRQSLFLPDMEKHSQLFEQEIKGKTALVIGGAGTIGSSFIRALVRYQPAKLIVVDINENGLTELVRDCRSRSDLKLPADFKTYPINFNDAVFEKILKQEGPFDIVANFAAHKHVRSEKDIFSIEAMIDNNVIRAKKLLDLLLEHSPRHFFCVSTDKAANPVNVMGASKKLMEEVILAYSQKIKITTARFANVAFSNGSLLAGFIERLIKQQPLSCPSDVKRFFVSPDESGQICLSACILGTSGDIFFPKLAEETMVKFADVVAPFLKEMGYEVNTCASEDEARAAVTGIPGGKYPVYFFSSNTSGEKLYEEFYTEAEDLDLESYQSFGIVKNAERRSLDELDKVIDGLKQVFTNHQATKKDIVSVLNTMIPGFEHIETGMNLDQKM
ncbi:nucleoside-diphosphate sugar epimerase [Niabella ginsenosidivorans]|uniref:Nucleoside-diphosphate sugar epimerase n=1 Tax=Niabella ginsenosidivorans TaxID=1176587 RepID=A0A1A9I2X9_9BACT|nr:UDP-N-acetylglucosamine 4,6-dehydratase [Niabella ginsenosidivorans]ANH80924.1 nucleoside-diphosphate sugar epimerase [Niabella ginsenosidivorans]